MQSKRAAIAGYGGVLVVLFICFCGCSQNFQAASANNALNNLRKQRFGTVEGKDVYLYTLTNSRGTKAQITNYGAVLVSLEVPDRDGKLRDVVLGYDSLNGYINDESYFGCIAGRYANRIAQGRFTLDGKEYKLTKNDGKNHLHGGLQGFNKVVWNSQPAEAPNGVGIRLQHLSPDGHEGYPGNLDVRVTYILTDRDELKIEYQAKTDEATIFNPTHHSYFNLAGQGQGDILNHQLTLNADLYVPVNSDLIPTGELSAVQGTVMDFTKPQTIGKRINSDFKQLEFGKGYDHCWVLNKSERGELSLAARVYEPRSGRLMEVWTTDPGIQLYSGNFLDGSVTGKNGKVYGHRYGFCLEPEHFPDSPNKTHFPSVVLWPGQTYRKTTIYRFSTK